MTLRVLRRLSHAVRILSHAPADLNLRGHWVAFCAPLTPSSVSPQRDVTSTARDRNVCQLTWANGYRIEEATANGSHLRGPHIVGWVTSRGRAGERFYAEGPVRSVKPVSRLQWDGGFAAESGCSRNPFRTSGVRPFETIAVRSASDRPRPEAGIPVGSQQWRERARTGHSATPAERGKVDPKRSAAQRRSTVNFGLEKQKNACG